MTHRPTAKKKVSKIFPISCDPKGEQTKSGFSASLAKLAQLTPKEDKDIILANSPQTCIGTLNPMIKVYPVCDNKTGKKDRFKRKEKRALTGSKPTFQVICHRQKEVQLERGILFFFFCLSSGGRGKQSSSSPRFHVIFHTSTRRVSI